MDATTDLMNVLYAFFISFGLHFLIGVIKSTWKNEEDLLSRKYGKTNFINMIIGTIAILFLFSGSVGLIQNLVN